MKAYYVKYLLNGEWEEPKGIGFLARDKFDAYDKAVFELIPQKEGKHPYSAWVYSVTYNNGNCRKFNTYSGKPY